MNQKKNDGYLEKSAKYKGFHYSVLSQEMFEYHHKTTFDMMKIIIDIFHKNNIKYIIVGGTLLGAYTRKTFIPWDDDVDISVFEDDYEKAINCLIKGLPSDYVVQCKQTDENYYLGWTKVRDKNSHVYPDAPVFKENGVWVDIYKLSFIKKKQYPYFVAKENYEYVKRRFACGGLTKREYKIRNKKNHLLLKVVMEKVRSLFNLDQSKGFLIHSASKIFIKYEWMFPLQLYVFNGLDVYSLNRADLYLIEHYGSDYGIFPPEEKRRVGINKIEY